MNFWEFLWALIKVGLLVYVGIPLLIIILILIFI